MGPHLVKAELAKWLFSAFIAPVILSPTDAHGNLEASAILSGALTRQEQGGWPHAGR